MPDVPEDYIPEVVIADRYLAVPEAKIYFPYMGVVYPLGAFGAGRHIQFGPQLVEETIHAGYTDEREEAFIAMMKEEYMLTPQPLRDFIYQRNIEKYGDPFGPSFDWLIDNTKTYKDIINSASHPNVNIDKLIPDFKKWLKEQ